MFPLLAEAASTTPIIPADYSVPWFIAYPIAVVMGGAILTLFKALLSANAKKSAEELTAEKGKSGSQVQREVDHQARIDNYTKVLKDKDDALERCQNARVTGMESAVTAIVTMNERQKTVLGLLENVLDRLNHGGESP